MPPTEATLIRLHTEYALMAFRFAWSVTRDETLAQDVVQELFLKLARGVFKIEEARSERSVLFRITRNLALDALRRGRARANLADRWAAEIPEWFEPVSDLDQDETRRRLTECLAGLPEEQRSVIHLHLWEELSFREIGELFNASTQTIASRYRYGLEKLRGALQHLQALVL